MSWPILSLEDDDDAPFSPASFLSPMMEQRGFVLGESNSQSADLSQDCFIVCRTLLRLTAHFFPQTPRRVETGHRAKFVRGWNRGRLRGDAAEFAKKIAKEGEGEGGEGNGSTLNLLCALLRKRFLENESLKTRTVRQSLSFLWLMLFAKIIAMEERSGRKCIHGRWRRWGQVTWTIPFRCCFKVRTG